MTYYYYVVSNNFNALDRQCDIHITTLEHLPEYFFKKKYLYRVILKDDQVDNLDENNYKFTTHTSNISSTTRYLMYSKKTVSELGLQIDRTYLLNYVLCTRDLLVDKLNFIEENKILIDEIFIADLYCKNKEELNWLLNNKLISKYDIEECIETFSCYEDNYKNIEEFLKPFIL